jgi:hypothetical protein
MRTALCFRSEFLLWTEVNPRGTVPPARMVHTLSQISPTEAILFGGAGLQQEFDDVYLLTDGEAFYHQGLKK